MPNKNKQIIYDIAIIGGGINGCGIARDAAGRGLKTYLCDKSDLGGETSCYSSKLIHGGLRYLEYYEFSLVRKALIERDNLLHIAPHLVHEQRFVIPHNKHLRPAWLIRLGLFLYDNLHQSKFLQKSGQISLNPNPLKAEYKKAFEYSDCVTDDHRLVIANALDAHSNGASINPHTICESACVKDGLWQLSTKDENGNITHVYAKSLVNATGPWVENFVKTGLNLKPTKQLRLVKGSHIVTKKLYEGNEAYTFQDKKGRIVFTVPYQKNYTLIGTTEEEFTGNPSKAAINESERVYLSSVIREYFNKPINNANVVWHFAGVRPLINDDNTNALKTTRDYSIELKLENELPFVNVWGGKLTTYRILAEDVLAQLSKHINTSKKWSARTPLNTSANPKQIMNEITVQYPWLNEDVVNRLAYNYGKSSFIILEGCKKTKDLGENFGAQLYLKEVQYLIKHEWANSAEAILWRRTKCGLHMNDKQREAFAKIFPSILNAL